MRGDLMTAQRSKRVGSKVRTSRFSGDHSNFHYRLRDRLRKPDLTARTATSSFLIYVG